MSTTREPWFVEERSEALAGLLLTSRKDVRVRDERKHESGLDFLVGGNRRSRTLIKVNESGNHPPNFGTVVES